MKWCNNIDPTVKDKNWGRCKKVKMKQNKTHFLNSWFRNPALIINVNVETMRRSVPWSVSQNTNSIRYMVVHFQNRVWAINRTGLQVTATVSRNNFYCTLNTNRSWTRELVKSHSRNTAEQYTYKLLRGTSRQIFRCRW